MENLDETPDFEMLRSVYGMGTGEPVTHGSLLTLANALTHLECALKQSVLVEEAGVIEAPRWWYLPYIWIGCAGYILDKSDGYIRQLGSCHSLDDCFWSQNKGIKYGYSDLIVTRVKDVKKTVNTLMELGNRASPINPIPNKDDDKGKRTKFWTPRELETEIGSCPVTFENQILWFTIPYLREACERGYFEFEVTQGSWDAQFALNA